MMTGKLGKCFWSKFADGWELLRFSISAGHCVIYRPVPDEIKGENVRKVTTEVVLREKSAGPAHHPKTRIRRAGEGEIPEPPIMTGKNSIKILARQESVKKFRRLNVFDVKNFILPDAARGYDLSHISRVFAYEGP